MIVSKWSVCNYFPKKLSGNYGSLILLINLSNYYRHLASHVGVGAILHFRLQKPYRHKVVSAFVCWELSHTGQFVTARLVNAMTRLEIMHLHPFE